MQQTTFPQLLEELDNQELLDRRKADIEDSLNYLTPLEKAVLRVLLHVKSALSPSEIRNYFISDIWNVVLLTVAGEESMTGGHIKPFFQRELFDPYFYVHITTNKKQIDKTMKQVRDLPDYKRYVTIANFLADKEIIKLPNYRTIERALNDLTTMGFLVVRAVCSGKTKKLYAPHPILNRLDLDFAKPEPDNYVKD